MVKFSDYLENWMGNLPSELKQVPIIHLAIPGSHDTMTFGISLNAPVAPDADDFVATLNKYFPCAVRRWVVTQEYNMTEQLKNGVRYFDLRTCLNIPDGKFYFVHGLYAEEITGSLKALNDFLDTHPNEFVILDFQHFYLFDNNAHSRLAVRLLDIFGTKFYTRQNNKLSLCTLASSISNKKQILAIYRNDQNMTENYWYSRDWPTPWPQTVKVKELEDYLERNLQNRSPNAGYVSQCVLTPTSDFIIPRFYSSLRKKCAVKVDKKLSDWIKQQEPGTFKEGEKAKSNVFLADFVNLRKNNFTKIVVDLNHKILLQK